IGRQGNKGQVKERDNCADAGVATVTRDDNRHFTVTAGSTAGSCTARFTTGGGQGNGGKLSIHHPPSAPSARAYRRAPFGCSTVDSTTASRTYHTVNESSFTLKYEGYHSARRALCTAA